MTTPEEVDHEITKDWFDEKQTALIALECSLRTATRLLL